MSGSSDWRDMSEQDRQARVVKTVVDATPCTEGAGLPIRRCFPAARLDQVDPFLLLDHVGPMRWAPGEAVGMPEHPHRGFEILTYLFDGALVHSGARGEEQKLEPGDVQWVTAGSGILHSELPDPSLRQKGGVIHGIELWVNLPSKDKMIPPRYQRVPAAGVPEHRAADGGVVVRLLVGKALDLCSRIETSASVIVLHLSIAPGESFSMPVPRDWSGVAYLVSGQGLFGRNDVSAGVGSMVWFSSGQGVLEAKCPRGGPDSLEAMLLVGEPIREPVARGGAFVMNTRDEILQAFEDHRDGRLCGK